MDEICDLLGEVSTSQLLSLTGIDHRRLNALLITRSELKAQLHPPKYNNRTASSSVNPVPKMPIRRTLAKPNCTMVELGPDIQPSTKSDLSLHADSPVPSGSAERHTAQCGSSFSPPPCGESFFEEDSDDKPLPSTLASFKNQSSNNSPATRTTPTFVSASSVLLDSKPKTPGSRTSSHTLVAPAEEHGLNLFTGCTDGQNMEAPSGEPEWLLDDGDCLPDDAVDEFAASVSTDDCWLSTVSTARKEGCQLDRGVMTTPGACNSGQMELCV